MLNFQIEKAQLLKKEAVLFLVTKRILKLHNVYSFLKLVYDSLY